MSAGQHFDGKHGVVADSLSVSWQDVANVSGTNAPPAKFSGPRVTPDVGDRLVKGHDWTLYELIDRTQVYADNALTLRALDVSYLDLQFGRGRVFDAPYEPNVNANQFPFRAPPAQFANNKLTRNRVTSFRGTVMTSGISAQANEVINDITQPPVYVLENYRSFISEGRPVIQRTADYAFVSSRAELDIPIVSTGFGQFITPVPDYATGLRVDNPKAAFQTATDLCVAWVDITGNRFPGSAANFAQGQYVSDVTSQLLTVPWWATGMHLYNGNPLIPGPALAEPIFITWELLL